MNETLSLDLIADALARQAFDTGIPEETLDDFIDGVGPKSLSVPEQNALYTLVLAKIYELADDADECFLARCDAQDRDAYDDAD